MATMQVELVSVERPLWSGEATAVYARTTEGEIGIMAGHSPLLATLVPGWIVRIQREGESELRVAVHNGSRDRRRARSGDAVQPGQQD